MKRLVMIVDEAADFPSEDWEPVLQAMKDGLGEGELVAFSTNQSENWVSRLWVRSRPNHDSLEG